MVLRIVQSVDVINCHGSVVTPQITMILLRLILQTFQLQRYTHDYALCALTSVNWIRQYSHLLLVVLWSLLDPLSCAVAVSQTNPSSLQRRWSQIDNYAHTFKPIDNIYKIHIEDNIKIKSRSIRQPSLPIVKNLYQSWDMYPKIPCLLVNCWIHL